MQRRLVCVSNRIALPRRAGAAGGLAVGVLAALRRTGGVWSGWNGELDDAEPGAAHIQMRDGVPKGLVERFAAYEQFLEAFPENQGRMTYLQIAPLSRNDVQSYVEIRRALEQATGRTNGRFADTDWTPVRYVNRNLPHAE